MGVKVVHRRIIVKEIAIFKEEALSDEEADSEEKMIEVRRR